MVVKFDHNFCGIIGSKSFQCDHNGFFQQKIENQNLFEFMFFEVLKVTLSKFKFSLF